MNLGDRLRSARITKQWSQETLSKKSGVSQQVISKIESGKAKKSTQLVALAKALEVTAEWLETGHGVMDHPYNAIKGEQTPSGRLIHSAPPQDLAQFSPILIWENPEDLPEGRYVLIQRRRVQLSAGNGTMVLEEEEADPLAFSSRWVKRRGLRHSDAVVVYATGDSMEPRIYDGNILVVNLRDRDVRDGKIYAIRYGGELRVKRLFRRYDGSLILRSDNTAMYPDEIVPPSDQDGHIQVLGRVIAGAWDDD